MAKEKSKAKYEKAMYTEQIIREYQGNPLIESLPDIVESPQEFVNLTAFIPEIREEDRNLPATYRAHLIERIDVFFKPLNYHIEVEQKISRMIRNGYINKNPYFDKKINSDKLKYGMTKVDSSTVAELGIFGISGMGKTTMIKKILSLYPQMILHTDYKGDKTLRFQIPWIKVETPSGCRLKGLSLNILTEIDRLFGEEKYYRIGNNKREYEQLNYLRDVFEQHYVGLLVIDEIQNIQGIASKESDKIMRFLVELSNVINVPIVLIGTLKAMPLFSKEMKNCRRIADSKPMYKLENDREWKALMKSLFKLQWTKIKVEVTDELIETLHEESQGVPDIAIKLFKFAQFRAIYTGEERITKGIIKSVASDSLIPLQPLLLALKLNNQEKLMKYEDLYDASVYFNEYKEKEEKKVAQHEKYMLNDDFEFTDDKIYNIMKSIASFIIQAGFEIKPSEKVAKKVINEFGSDLDINLLKRYAYERIMKMKPDPKQPGQSTPKSVEMKKNPKTKKALNRKIPESGMIKVLDVEGAEHNNSETVGYEALKNNSYISPTNEFVD